MRKIKADYPDQSLNEIARNQGMIERDRRHRDDAGQPAHKGARAAYDIIYPNSMLGPEHMKAFTEGFESGEKYNMKPAMKFKADFGLKPAYGRLKDLGDLGYMTIDDVEDPGQDVPAGMSPRDWAIYRSNWQAAAKLFPEGGVEGQAAFIKEHPGEQYPGDVVHQMDHINIYKGAASRIKQAEQVVKQLSDYPVLDENLWSALETEALDHEIDSWALDETKRILGYDKNWADLLTDEEAAWLEANPEKRTGIEQAIDGIYDPTKGDLDVWRMAIRDALSYGDWTVVHEPQLKEALAATEEGKKLLDPEATMHQLLKTQMRGQEPGTKEYQEGLEKEGQIRLLESLKAAQTVVIGELELKALLASEESLRSAMDVAGPVAVVIGGHEPVAAFGGAFFTYSVKGRLMAAAVTAFPDQTFGVAWAPLEFFGSVAKASSVLVGQTMFSFEAGTKALDVAKAIQTTESEYRVHAGQNFLCDASRRRMEMWAKTPKGYEPVVKELKKAKGVDNPWAVAWSMKNKGIKPKASKIKASGRFGIWNGIDDLPAFPEPFGSEAEAQSALAQFKKRFEAQGYYKSAAGEQLPLTALEADGEGGGIFVVSEAEAPEEFEQDFGEGVKASGTKYKDYTIEKSGDNFYVKDPSGHRAFGEVPASIETAKKWIDQDIIEKRPKVKAGIQRRSDGSWIDTYSNLYDTAEQAAQEEAWFLVDAGLDKESPEAKAQHAVAVKRLLSNVQASMDSTTIAAKLAPLIGGQADGSTIICRDVMMDILEGSAGAQVAGGFTVEMWPVREEPSLMHGEPAQIVSYVDLTDQNLDQVVASIKEEMAGVAKNFDLTDENAPKIKAGKNFVAIGNEDVPGHEPKEDEPEGNVSVEDVDDAESPGDLEDAEGIHSVQEVAGWWHGGQFTELYKLSSSGTVDSVSDLKSEINSSIKTLDQHPASERAALKDQLNYLLDWASALEKVAGAKP